MVSPLVLFYAFAVGVSFAATFVTLSYIAWGYQKYWARRHRRKPPPKRGRERPSPSPSSKAASETEDDGLGRPVGGRTKEIEKEPFIPIAQPFLYILVRLSYGLGNVVNVMLGNTLISAMFVGVILGCLFVILSHKLNLPKTLFGIKTRPCWFNILTPLTFALIFVVIIRSLNAKFILL